MFAWIEFTLVVWVVF